MLSILNGNARFIANDAGMQLALLLPLVALTATISGALGMGGGVILMGLLAALLPAPAAIALHGAVQLSSNLFRGWLLRREIERRALAFYALGAALSLVVCARLTLVPSNRALFLGLGSVAIAGTLGRRWLGRAVGAKFGGRLGTLSMRSPLVAAGCGATVTATHLVAGAAGPLLDVFFLESSLSRKAVVATKAATQSLSHGAKIAYFVLLAPAVLSTSGVPLWGYAALVAGALLGTLAGTRLLERLSEQRFRKLTYAFVLGLGLVYFARGLWVR